MTGFNEAAAICGGNALREPSPGGGFSSFNEAAAICGGNAVRAVGVPDIDLASMRPPQFAAETLLQIHVHSKPQDASMRPPQFAAETFENVCIARLRSIASMRPPQFAAETPTNLTAK